MSQDYILRLIGQLGAMLAAIIAKRRAGLLVEARADVNAFSIQAVGMPLHLVRQMAPEALTQHLHGSGTPDHARAVILAELLIQEAEMDESAGNSQAAITGALHAFCLLTTSWPHLAADDQAGYRQKIDILAAKLAHLSSNPYLAEKLADWQKLTPLDTPLAPAGSA